MNAYLPVDLRRLLILLFAAVCMFGCATGSAMSHTADAVTSAVASDDHGHGHDGQSGGGHGLSGHHNAADHTHDTAHFPQPHATDRTVPSIGWFPLAPSAGVLGIAYAMDRPPRVRPVD